MQTTIHPIFHPDVHFDQPTDLILTSADNVQFHIHRDRVVTSSTNCFNLLLLLPTTEPIVLAEPSAIISTILCLIYDKPFDSEPLPPAILASFDALHKYGLPSKKYLTPPSRLFAATQAQLLTQSTDFALDIYARASQDDLSELAKAASPILLSLTLPLTEPAQLHKIHPVYLQKLFALHSERLDALRQLLRTPPAAHPQTSSCGSEGRERLVTNWNIQASQVVLSSESPAIPPADVRKILSKINSSLTCEDCKTKLKDGIDRVVHGWESTKNTI
ncbi:hypothetical protein QCA50_014209 [Cerrena zonata]|uniref:BTB domain-containing protein n=1 Tax=Cerrena zonata TaxID=2478898 RepID=A0AAW0G1A2_9APHY